MHTTEDTVSLAVSDLSLEAKEFVAELPGKAHLESRPASQLSAPESSENSITSPKAATKLSSGL